MTKIEASEKAAKLFNTFDNGVAGDLGAAILGRKSTPKRYKVGVYRKGESTFRVLGESAVSFEDAFAQAEIRK